MGNFKIYFYSFILVMSLSACARGGFQTANITLPDDATSEPPSSGQGQVVTPPPVDTGSTTGSGTETGTNTGIQTLAEKYSYVDPTGLVPAKYLTAALTYYDAHLSSLGNTNYLSVIDFSQFSGNKRFYIINMKTGSVWNIRVAHGSGSDPTHDGYAHTFSNVSGSNASSVGIYKTAETYTGDNGLSLRLDGLSSTNSNARDRAIVVHGADYVEEANVIQGRSWGCPAVAAENRDQVISMIKGGSIIYAAAN